jgi:hypothetical protein
MFKFGRQNGRQCIKYTKYCVSWYSLCLSVSFVTSEEYLRHITKIHQITIKMGGETGRHFRPDGRHEWAPMIVRVKDNVNTVSMLSFVYSKHCFERHTLNDIKSNVKIFIF